jgi:hypothetical protein
MRYSVDIAIEITERPAREVSESARNLSKLADLLPEGANLRELHLPETTGVVEVRVDMDAAGPADALHTLSLAAELVAAYAGGIESLGPLHHATVTQLAIKNEPAQ